MILASIRVYVSCVVVGEEMVKNRRNLVVLSLILILSVYLRIFLGGLMFSIFVGCL